MRKASGQKRAVLVPNPKAKLFDQLREVMRFHHYSYRTEKTYAQWIRRYLAFHRQSDRTGPDRGWRHPRRLGAREVALCEGVMKGSVPQIRMFFHRVSSPHFSPCLA